MNETWIFFFFARFRFIESKRSEASRLGKDDGAVCYPFLAIRIYPFLLRL